MFTSDKEVVQLIVDQCKLHGVKRIVFSPGSRNSPFAIAFDEDKDFKSFLIHDERSAAFFALGLAQNGHDLVALCCTSGSALLNYYPAISEAFYRNIPLLIISADRPLEWIDQGDGQTIRQGNIFQKHSHGFLQLNDEILTQDKLWYYQRETSVLLNKLKQGPVHFNVSLKEPLYQSVEKKISFAKKIEFISSNNNIKIIDIQYIKKLMSLKKILVVCGQTNYNQGLLNSLVRFSSQTDAVILTEHTSNLSNGNFISCIDRTLNYISFDDDNYSPEVVIHIGGAIVSKKIKSYLRNCKNLNVIRISNEDNIQDTFQHLTHYVQVEPSIFFDQLNDFESRNEHNYFGKWKKLDLLARDRTDEISDSFAGLNDWFCFYLFQQYLKEGTVVHMANSSVVRYMMLFDMINNCSYFSNRGTSGIDGSFSTAVGAAIASPQENHLFICGDISFIYDHNALWIENFPMNLRVIVINNSGGGIFRIIDGAKDSSKNERYFEASHSQEIKPIVSAFLKNISQISNFDELEPNLRNLLSFESDQPQFIEIKTDRFENPNVLSNFFKSIK